MGGLFSHYPGPGILSMLLVKHPGIVLLSCSPCPVSNVESGNPGRPYQQCFIFVPSDQWVGAVGSLENQSKNTAAESISPTFHLIQKRGNF